MTRPTLTWRVAIAAQLPHRRTALKWLHWLMLPLFVWFMFVQPADVARFGPKAVRFHSVMGLIFVSLALIWTARHLRHGLVGRAGPKLPPWARRLHQLMHRTLIWGVFLVALTGLGLGLTAARQLWAGGLVPIGIPFDMPQMNDLIGRVHAIEFYALTGLAIAHATFHVWRHMVLRDNALRIMFPKALHRFL